MILNLQRRFIDRTLARLSQVFRDAAGQARVVLTGLPRPDLPDDDLNRIERQILQCLEDRGGEVSSRARAAELGQIFLVLNEEGRKRFLILLAQRFGPDEGAIIESYEMYIASGNEIKRARALADLREALESPRIHLLRRFTSVPEGIKFLVDLRGYIAPLIKSEPILQILDDDLRRLLTDWFDIAFLDLREITWNAPASLLEKLIVYEAVHRITSWDDLKNRLDSDRRCFAFFHPRMPDEPLIFVEVALVEGMASSIQVLLDQDKPALVTHKADTAIFYSISNCQKGLNGISFGDFLIKRVVGHLSRELPQLKTFATLSPIPGFRAWLDEGVSLQNENFLLPDEAAEIMRLAEVKDLADAWKKLFGGNWWEEPANETVLKPILLRLCARYLATEKIGQQARDRVAHFHLSNGARVEQVNWLGDISPKGMKQSYGMMVNYLYKLGDIESNHEVYRGEGQVTVSSVVRRLVRM